MQFRDECDSTGGQYVNELLRTDPGWNPSSTSSLLCSFQLVTSLLWALAQPSIRMVEMSAPLQELSPASDGVMHRQALPPCRDGRHRYLIEARPYILLWASYSSPTWRDRLLRRAFTHYPHRLENVVMEIINQGWLLWGGDIYNGLWHIQGHMRGSMLGRCMGSEGSDWCSLDLVCFQRSSCWSWSPGQNYWETMEPFLFPL